MNNVAINARTAPIFPIITNVVISLIIVIRIWGIISKKCATPKRKVPSIIEPIERFIDDEGGHSDQIL